MYIIAFPKLNQLQLAPRRLYRLQERIGRELRTRQQLYPLRRVLLDPRLYLLKVDVRRLRHVGGNARQLAHQSFLALGDRRGALAHARTCSAEPSPTPTRGLP